MGLQTTFAERVIHLALFVAAGLLIGVAAFAALERIAGEGTRAVRAVHLVACTGLVAAAFLGERLYHALH